MAAIDTPTCALVSYVRCLMPTIDELTAEIREVALLVHAAQEQSDDRDRVIAAHHGVERLSQHYRELTVGLSEGEKLRVERTVGRRVTDLRRLASLLPRVGVLTGSTPDRQISGPSVAGERRITGVSWRNDAPRPRPDTPHVGGEIEAWCGPCEGMTTHRIVAMVGSEPKQVVCSACSGRHNFRTTPARKGAPEPAAAPVRQSSPAELEAARKAEKKEEELRALGRELAEATDVKRFDPKERYRPGDVISHPDYGRGKVETVLRSSLLVRFPQGGLKSLILI
jgi:hypothetical protein